MTVDVIGVACEVSAVTAIKLKSGDTKDRLNVVIADETNFSVPVTVWGDMCQPLANSVKRGDIIAFKSCRVSDYNGKGLNASGSPQDCVTQVKHNRALQLKKWFTTDESVLGKVESLSTGGGSGE